MKTITIGNDISGYRTIPVPEIQYAYLDIDRKKPVIIFFLRNGDTAITFYWNERACHSEWKTIKNSLEDEYIADFNNLIFRPELVTITKKGQNAEQLPTITIGFQWGFEHIRVFVDIHRMESEYGRLMRILAQSRALLESLKMPHNPHDSER